MMPIPLSERQLSLLREAARVSRLVSVVSYPGGRLEDVASSGWDAERVPLPTDPEVRVLVRSGHLLSPERTAATSFYIADEGRRAIADDRASFESHHSR